MQLIAEYESDLTYENNIINEICQELNQYDREGWNMVKAIDSLYQKYISEIKSTKDILTTNESRNP